MSGAGCATCDEGLTCQLLQGPSAEDELLVWRLGGHHHRVHHRPAVQRAHQRSGLRHLPLGLGETGWCEGHFRPGQPCHMPPGWDGFLLPGHTKVPRKHPNGHLLKGRSVLLGGWSGAGTEDRGGERRGGGRGARAEQGTQGQPPMLELGRSAPWGLGIPCDPLDSISRELPRARRACRPVCGWAESRPGRVSCLG